MPEKYQNNKITKKQNKNIITLLEVRKPKIKKRNMKM
jgi:hypothetical protein